MPRYLVTAALPYANGPLHFGHIAGAYLPSDVYARTLRQQGEEVLFVCGTDEHGVAITQSAEQAGVDYGTWVARWRAEIGATFDALGIRFDMWSGTSVAPRHAEFSQDFFRRLNTHGYLLRQTSEQLFSPTENQFLADRYVVGGCPKCGYEKARGDECPRCGAWLDALELIEPRSRRTGAPLERRPTTHWYLDLPKLRDEALGRWVSEHEWKSNVAPFLAGLVKDTLPRAITRDMAWGVPLPEDTPDYEHGKVLYVWFDAPIGYISITAQWAAERGDPDGWKRWWQDPDTRLVHFLGKDNIPFHCFVFPAMLYGQKQGYVLPWQVPANEFYNLEGKKFSTSEGWTIPLNGFLERHDPEIARFYLLASCPETADSEWLWEGYQAAAGQLADAIGNLATRVLRFIAKNNQNRVPPFDADRFGADERTLLEQCGAIADPGEHIRGFRFRRAAEALIANATIGNVFIDRLAPWTLRKTDPERAEAVLHLAVQWIANLARWLAPVCPAKAQSLWAMCGGSGEAARAGWPAGLEAGGAWRPIAAGTDLGEIAALFRKLDDSEVATERAALVTAPASPSAPKADGRPNS